MIPTWLNKVPRDKTVPLPICPPHITHGKFLSILLSKTGNIKNRAVWLQITLRKRDSHVIKIPHIRNKVRMESESRNFR